MVITTSLVVNQVLNGKYGIVHEAKSAGPIGVGVMSSPPPIDGNVGPIRQEQMRRMQRGAGHVLTVPPQERPSLGILRQVAVLGEPVRVQYGVEVLGPRGVRAGRRRDGRVVYTTTSLLRREDVLQQIQIRRAVKASQMAAGGPLGLHDGEERGSFPQESAAQQKAGQQTLPILMNVLHGVVQDVGVLVRVEEADPQLALSALGLIGCARPRPLEVAVATARRGLLLLVRCLLNLGARAGCVVNAATRIGGRFTRPNGIGSSTCCIKSFHWSSAVRAVVPSTFAALVCSTFAALVCGGLCGACTLARVLVLLQQLLRRVIGHLGGNTSS
mmetsp:Transcript_21965/g.62998  ORF Transcript_21965/g.62998 Transcript_21965/m.62998 type:complete len:329 (-) Transcript_21965:99-1085(-)